MASYSHDNAMQRFERALPLVASVVVVNVIVAIICPTWHQPPPLKSQGKMVAITVAVSLLPLLWTIWLLLWKRSGSAGRLVALLSLLPAMFWLVYAGGLLVRYFF